MALAQINHKIKVGDTVRVRVIVLHPVYHNKVGVVMKKISNKKNLNPDHAQFVIRIPQHPDDSHYNRFAGAFDIQLYAHEIEPANFWWK